MAKCFFADTTEFNPEPIVRQYCDALRASDAEDMLLLVSYSFSAFWLDGKPRSILAGLYCLEKNKTAKESIEQQTSENHHQQNNHQQNIEISFTVTDAVESVKNFLENHHESNVSTLFCAIKEQFSLPVFSSSSLLFLSSVSIAKPWGKEIWYTGIEARGVAKVSDQHFQLPLPWVLSALPTSLCANHQQSLILLKILDPLPEPVFGDLYFELHQQKREVYVVTGIDRHAWPTGQGEIRFGFDQEKRRQYASDNDFRVDFVRVVKKYQRIRETIDKIIDECRRKDNIQLTAPVPAKTLVTWLTKIPEKLREDERKLRSEMDLFSYLLPLQVGDVVKVPCLTPHSLQHGVRTVEFQTPVYERLIVSFAQKVLTQANWDTDAAAAIMNLDAPAQPDHQCLIDAEGVLVERIVDFEDFEVLRIVLQVGTSYFISSPIDYGLMMAVKGEIVLRDNLISPEQAVLIPTCWPGGHIENSTDEVVSLLLAYPKCA